MPIPVLYTYHPIYFSNERQYLQALFAHTLATLGDLGHIAINWRKGGSYKRNFIVANNNWPVCHLWAHKWGAIQNIQRPFVLIQEL